MLHRFASPLGVALVVGATWLVAMLHFELFDLFVTRWPMSVTMSLGAFVAGATSEGGGAVAFPVMTLVFGIAPPVARDFGLAIQSVGMTAASLAIIGARVRVVWPAVVIAGLAGAVGLIVGRTIVSPQVVPSDAKLFFTSLWLAFGLSLYLLNRNPERATRQSLGPIRPRLVADLVLVGLLGGMVSGLTSSGLDIVTFSLLVLRYRICESVATPTSVVLMASNSLFAVAHAATVGPPIADAAWAYWWVCVPVVVVFAPLGARVMARLGRVFAARFLYVSVVAQFVGALIILPLDGRSVVLVVAVLTLGLLLFGWMARRGERALHSHWGAHPGLN